MERETGIEPATSSLGSCRQPFGERRINELQRAERATVGHYGCQLNTILNTNLRKSRFAGGVDLSSQLTGKIGCT
jgi:hypothetical protein